MRLTTILWLTLLIVLPACETIPNTSGAPIVGVKSVAIVSVLGDEFGVALTGTTVFGNAGGKGNIESWQIDEAIQKKSLEVLGGRYDARVLAPTDETNSEIIARNDARQSTSANVDAYIVIRPVERNPGYFRGNHDFRGVGLYQEKTAFVGNTFVYVSADLVVIDGKTLKEIRRVPLSTGTRTGKRSTLMDRVWRIVDPKNVWAENFDDLSEDQKERARSGLLILLDSAVENSLASVGLTAREASH